jgi:hypothetical protein
MTYRNGEALLAIADIAPVDIFDRYAMSYAQGLP